jgi:hypothetical protein
MKMAERAAVFRDEIGPWRPAPAIGGATLVASSPGHVLLELTGGGERLLAASIVGPRGWSARADGRELQTLTVNGAFLGVRLPARASRVELRYLPPGFVMGCVAFGVAAVLLLLLPFTFPSAAPALRRRAKPRPAARR